LTTLNTKEYTSVTPTILTALLASGLAVALSREHRIRRAFQDLAARLLNKLRERSGYAAEHRGPSNNPTSHRRRS
jgi:hypothetical protein